MLRGIPRYRDMGMRSHVLGCPSLWGTPAYGHAFPCTGVLQNMGMHPHMMLGYPSIRECIPIFWVAPVNRVEKGSISHYSQTYSQPDQGPRKSMTTSQEFNLEHRHS
jgi:hypothetical protein